MFRKAGWLVLAAIVVLWVIRDPHGAAHAAQGIGHFATQAAAALGTLAKHL
jgi:hypothetical protein